jgi:hypothetical protein
MDHLAAPARQSVSKRTISCSRKGAANGQEGRIGDNDEIAVESEIRLGPGGVRVQSLALIGLFFQIWQKVPA